MSLVKSARRVKNIQAHMGASTNIDISVKSDDTSTGLKETKTGR
jgi:hypothetical protein